MIRYLAGVRGSGKTTLVPRLIDAGLGAVVIDMDEVLVDGCVMDVPIAFSDARGAWPAYNRHWVLIASLIERSSPVLLLGPLVPSEWRAAGGDPTVPFALLDCADDVRGARLAARGWPDEDVLDALRDAESARRAIPTRISTDQPVDATVADVIAWIQSTS